MNLKTLLSRINPYALSATLSGLLIVLFYYPDLVLNANSTLIVDGGDGIKNYYTYLYHIYYDSSFLTTESFGYPYTDQVVYTDGTPLVAWFVKLLPFLKPYSIGVFHLFLAGSFAFAGWLNFKVLRQLRVDQISSLLGAIAILLLQPQIHRIPGHFSLAVPFVLPLIFFLVLRHPAAKKSSYIYLFLATFLTSWIHPYLGAMMAGVAFIAFLYLSIFDASNRWRNIYALGASVGGPVLFLLIVRLSDPAGLRPDYALGFFSQIASTGSVLHSIYSPFSDWTAQFLATEDVPWEGWAYIGVVSIFVLIGTVIYGIVKLLKTRRLSSLEFNPVYIGLGLGALAMLCLSMAIPFKWVFTNFFYDLPVLSNFRALGRFAWPFYYACAFLSMVVLHRLGSRHHILKRWRIPVAIGALIMAVEGDPQYRAIQDRILKSENHFHEDSEIIPPTTLEMAKRADAILPVPFFVEASDFMAVNSTEGTKKWAMLLAFHSGTPLMGRMNPRADIPSSEALASMMSMHRPPLERLGEAIDDDELILVYVPEGPNSIVSDHFIRAISEHAIEKTEKAYLVSYNAIVEKELVPACTTIDRNELAIHNTSFDLYGDQHFLEFTNRYRTGERTLSFWIEHGYKHTPNHTLIVHEFQDGQHVAENYYPTAGHYFEFEKGRVRFEMNLNFNESSRYEIWFMTNNWCPCEVSVEDIRLCLPDQTLDSSSE